MHSSPRDISTQNGAEGETDRRNSQFPLGVSAVMLPELDFDAQLSLCQSLGIQYYVYRPRVIADDLRQERYTNWGNHRFDLTPKRLVDEGEDLSLQLASRGLSPLCTLPEIDTLTLEDELEVHILGAANAGCTRLRLNPPEYSTGWMDYETQLQSFTTGYRQAIRIARTYGIKLVIEMHVMTAACGVGLTHAIVRDFDPNELGVILDLPNLAQQGEIDAALAISVLGPWVDHCHVGAARRIDDGRDRLGCRKIRHEFCQLTDGDLHVPTWIETLAELRRPVPLVVEDFTPNVSGRDRLTRTVEQLLPMIAEG